MNDAKIKEAVECVRNCISELSNEEQNQVISNVIKETRSKRQQDIEAKEKEIIATKESINTLNNSIHEK